MNIKKIVWPHDLSPAAAKAESFVASLSETYGAEVHLIYVATDLAHFELYWGSGPDPKHAKDLERYEMELSRQRLEDLCRKHLKGCPRYQIHILMGDPASEVLKSIDQIGADLVVIATRGMRNLFPFGSVAERIIKHSPVPVLTINPDTKFNG
jgi:nucleotide-binding universal stress UspA family protein